MLPSTCPTNQDHLMERLKGLLSHVDPHMTSGQLMSRLVGRARPPRPAVRRARAARPRRRRADFGGEDAGASAPGAASAKQEANAAVPSGDEAVTPLQEGPRPRPPEQFGSEARGRLNFGAEDAAPRPAGEGGVRRAGRLSLHLRGPHQRAPMRLPTPAADRPRRAVCPRRSRRAEQSPTAVRRSSPPPPRRRLIRRLPRRGSDAGPIQPAGGRRQFDPRPDTR